MNCRPLVAAVTLAVAPLAAQQPGKPDSMGQPMTGHGRMPAMMEGPMMREMGPAMMTLLFYAPQHLLARKDALDLTADQVARLTGLRDGLSKADVAAMAEAQAHLKELEQAASAPRPDTSALKVHFQAAHNAMGKAHWTMLAAAAQARAVLSDAQRAKVQAWADSMHAWTEQHRQMMKPSRPN